MLSKRHQQTTKIPGFTPRENLDESIGMISLSQIQTDITSRFYPDAYKTHLEKMRQSESQWEIVELKQIGKEKDSKIPYEVVSGHDTILAARELGWSGIKARIHLDYRYKNSENQIAFATEFMELRSLNTDLRVNSVIRTEITLEKFHEFIQDFLRTQYLSESYLSAYDEMRTVSRRYSTWKSKKIKPEQYLRTRNSLWNKLEYFGTQQKDSNYLQDFEKSFNN